MPAPEVSSLVLSSNELMIYRAAPVYHQELRKQCLTRCAAHHYAEGHELAQVLAARIVRVVVSSQARALYLGVSVPLL